MTSNLNAMERQLLTFALELAADQMATRGDEFDDGDRMALESLKAMATEPAPAADPADTLSAIRTALQADDITQVRRLVADYYADLRGAEDVPDFFRPGYTYTDAEFPQYEWRFRCDTVTTHPDNDERTALGWRFFRAEWEPYAYHEDDWDIAKFDGRASTGSPA